MSKNEQKGFFDENPFTAFFKGNLGILIGLAAIVIVLSFATKYFFTGENLLNILRQVSSNGILAFGMTFVILLGGIDLSVGSLQAFAGMTTAVLIATVGLPVWVAVMAGIGVGFGCGFANGFIIAKTGMPPFIVTLAMMTMGRGLAYIVGDGKPVRVMVDSFNQIGNGFIGPVSFPVIYMIVIFVLLVLLLNKTKFGRHVYAVGGNREAARFSGIKIARVEIIVYTLSGVLSAFAGVVLTARMYTGQPAIGSGAELDAIAAVVLGGTSMVGGRGKLASTIIGALVIGIINNGLNLLNVSSFVQMVVMGLVILVAVYIDTINKSKSGTKKQIKQPAQ